MAATAGTATITSRSRTMPQASSSTTEPTSSFMVRGITTGERRVSSITEERQSAVLPRAMPTHMRAATAVGTAYSSTSPVVNSGASGKHRVPSPSAVRGITTWSRPKVTATGSGCRATWASSRKPPPRLLAEGHKGEEPGGDGVQAGEHPRKADAHGHAEQHHRRHVAGQKSVQAA